jgi:hypothetical protein
VRTARAECLHPAGAEWRGGSPTRNFRGGAARLRGGVDRSSRSALRRVAGGRSDGCEACPHDLRRRQGALGGDVHPTRLLSASISTTSPARTTATRASLNVSVEAGRWSAFPISTADVTPGRPRQAPAGVSSACTGHDPAGSWPTCGDVGWAADGCEAAAFTAARRNRWSCSRQRWLRKAGVGRGSLRPHVATRFTCRPGGWPG